VCSFYIFTTLASRSFFFPLRLFSYFLPRYLFEKTFVESLDHCYILFGAKYYVPLPFATLAIISDESVVEITVNFWPQRRCRKLMFSVTTKFSFRLRQKYLCLPHFIIIVSKKFTPNCFLNEFVVKIEIGNYGIFSI